MTRKLPEIGRQIDASRQVLSEEIVERHYRRVPELAARYGEAGREKCRAEVAHQLNFLAQALIAGGPALFHDHIAWTKTVLAGRGIPDEDLAKNLRIMADLLREKLPVEAGAIAGGYVESALAHLPQMVAVPPSQMHPDRPLNDLARSYLDALLAGDRHRASQVILDAAKAGTPIEELYIHVFQQTQVEIGRLWQTNQISVAQEHYCTAITQMVMSQLYPQIFSRPRIGKRFVGACVASDLHEIGIRIVTDFFELAGWDSYYLGASVPCPDLIRTLLERKPQVVGISATLTTHIHALAKTVGDIRANCPPIIILVGGYPFHIVPDLWQQVGADGTSLSARGVAELANELLRKRGPT